MGTAVKYDKKIHLHVKGASEIILDLCTSYLHQDGQLKNFSSSEQTELLSVIESMAKDGLRTLAIAYKELSIDTKFEENENDEIHYKELTLLGVVGIEDPVRTEVPHAIAQCKRAGITVRMVTGDSKEKKFSSFE